MGGRAKDGAEPQPEDVAAYVAIMARELKDLAAPYDLRSLCYLLDLVRVEAEARARESPNRFAGPTVGSA